MTYSDGPHWMLLTHIGILGAYEIHVVQCSRIIVWQCCIKPTSENYRRWNLWNNNYGQHIREPDLLVKSTVNRIDFSLGTWQSGCTLLRWGQNYWCSAGDQYVARLETASCLVTRPVSIGIHCLFCAVLVISRQQITVAICHLNI